MRIDRDREQELATSVQSARGALLNLLTAHERKTKHRHGSAEPETFEDSAREIATWAVGRGPAVARALALYVATINAFWTHAQESDTAGYLVSTWRQKHKGYAWIDRETLECEALFKLRHFIGLFKAGNGNLADYSLRGMHQHLTEFAAKQGPVEVPRDASRATGPSSYRVDINLVDDLVEGLETHRLINALLDGDITDEDL